MKQLPREDWPVPVPFLIEVGRLAILWTTLEDLLNLLLGKLAGYHSVEDPRPFIIFKHATVPQRLDILGALCEHLSPGWPHLAEAPQIIGRIRKAQELRNRYLHCGLVYAPESGKCVMPRGTARGKLRVGVDPVELRDLRAACIEIHEATRELYRLVHKKYPDPVPNP